MFNHILDTLVSASRSAAARGHGDVPQRDSVALAPGCYVVGNSIRRFGDKEGLRLEVTYSRVSLLLPNGQRAHLDILRHSNDGVRRQFTQDILTQYSDDVRALLSSLYGLTGEVNAITARMSVELL